MDNHNRRAGAISGAIVAVLGIITTALIGTADATGGPAPVQREDVVVRHEVDTTPSVTLTSDDPGAVHGQPGRTLDTPTSSADSQAPIRTESAPAAAVVLRAADDPAPTTPAAPAVEPLAPDNPFAGGATQNPTSTQAPASPENSPIPTPTLAPDQP